MTLISILDLIKNDVFIRVNLREKIEKLYPGIFSYKENYFLEVKNWDNINYRFLIDILISLNSNLLDFNYWRCSLKNLINKNINLKSDTCSGILLFNPIEINLFSDRENLIDNSYIHLLNDEIDWNIGYENQSSVNSNVFITLSGDIKNVKIDEFILDIISCFELVYDK